MKNILIHIGGIDKIMGTRRYDFERYIYKERFQIILLGLVLLLVYGIRLSTLFITIDTEMIITDPANLYKSWITMGRWGLVLLKRILGTYTFNVYVAAFMMILSILATTVTWCYLFYLVNGKRLKNSLCIFGTLWFTSPIMAEQVAFLLQSYEVTIAIGLIAISLILQLEYKRDKKWYQIFSSFILLTISFATYQAMVLVYVTAATMIFLIYYGKNANVTDLKTKIIYILNLIILFLVAYFAYLFINMILLHVLNLQSNSYIEEQMLWGKQSVAIILSNIIEYIWNMLSGNGFFYNNGLIVLYVITLIILFIQHKMKDYWLYVMAMLFLFMCPFLMVAIRGGGIQHRTELTMPLVEAFLVLYVLDYMWSRTKKFYYIGLIFVLVAMMDQTQMSARLYYTSYVNNVQSVLFAIKISDRIEQLDIDTKTTPVVFIGRIAYERNNSCLERTDFELAGYGNFEISFYTMHGTSIMQNYLRVLGINYVLPNDDQIILAEDLAKNMKTWPNTDSVRLSNGIVVVKLSD